MMKGLGSFWREQEGAVAATYALALTGLIAIGGVAFDYTRMVGLDSELQNAADQAALAAVTQLDGEAGACGRAMNTAVGHLRNLTMLANDGSAAGNVLQVNGGTVSGTTDCSDQGFITFYSSYTDPSTFTLATGDADATVVKVQVDDRAARYVFTPIVGAIFNSLSARAVAGIGSAICDVPPLMICNPTPGTPFSGDANKGKGIQVTGNTGGGGWAAGDFGFLEVGAKGQLADLAKALAFDDIPLDCAPVTGTKPETGNAQVLFDAINTRFDIYDFSPASATALGDCNSGACSAASIVTKDLIKNTTAVGTQNNCKFHNSGWRAGADPYNPLGTATTVNVGGASLSKYHSGTLGAMGMPRDMCHYASFGTACGTTNNRFGDGNWGRGDYFAKNHPGKTIPSEASGWTRYQTYLWENQALKYGSAYPNVVTADSAMWGTIVPGGGKPSYTGMDAEGQRVDPICSTGKNSGTDNSDFTRRVLTVAVVENCAGPYNGFAKLNGGSNPVAIGEWVDMFFVEPVYDARGNGALSNSIYMEVIKNADLGEGGGGESQEVRKDKPYLIE